MESDDEDAPPFARPPLAQSPSDHANDDLFVPSAPVRGGKCPEEMIVWNYWFVNNTNPGEVKAVFLRAGDLQPLRSAGYYKDRQKKFKKQHGVLPEAIEVAGHVIKRGEPVPEYVARSFVSWLEANGVARPSLAVGPLLPVPREEDSFEYGERRPLFIFNSKARKGSEAARALEEEAMRSSAAAPEAVNEAAAQAAPARVVPQASVSLVSPVDQNTTARPISASESAPLPARERTTPGAETASITTGTNEVPPQAASSELERQLEFARESNRKAELDLLMLRQKQISLELEQERERERERLNAAKQAEGKSSPTNDQDKWNTASTEELKMLFQQMLQEGIAAERARFEEERRKYELELRQSIEFHQKKLSRLQAETVEQFDWNPLKRLRTADSSSLSSGSNSDEEDEDDDLVVTSTKRAAPSAAGTSNMAREPNAKPEWTLEWLQNDRKRLVDNDASVYQIQAYDIAIGAIERYGAHGYRHPLAREALLELSMFAAEVKDMVADALHIKHLYI